MSSSKKLHFDLNLDYKQMGTNYISQTNSTISKIMNNMYENYKENSINTFVLEYQDDLISLISLNILSGLSNFINNFNLIIYGKVEKTKKYLEKCDYSIVSELIDYDENQFIYVSCYNPIYKVIKSQKIFNKFLYKNSYEIVSVFTPVQFKIMSTFYDIQDLKLSKILYNTEVKDFQLFCDFIFHFSFEDNSNSTEDFPPIACIKITGDKDIDFDFYKDIIEYKGICFYFLEDEHIEYLLKSGLEKVLIFKTNIPSDNYGNINNKEFLRRCLLKNNFKIDYIGKWTEKEKAELF